MLQRDLSNVTGRLVYGYRETCVMLPGDFCNVTGRLV